MVRKKVGSCGRREGETTTDTGLYGADYVGGRGRRGKEILGPPWEVDLFCRRCALSGRPGPAGLLDVITQVGSLRPAPT